MSKCALVLATLFALVARADTNDLNVARQALRDGLWTLARAHAAKDASPEALLVTLESYASEGRWADVEKALPSLKDEGESPALGYYRAVLDRDYKKAARLLRESGGLSGGVEAKMLEADILSKSGDRNGAELLWREVMSVSNVQERAFVTAAVNLGDVDSLRAACVRAKSLPLRQLAGLRLGRKLLSDPRMHEEGAKLIRTIVREYPDAEGASSAFVALAAAQSDAGRFKEAARTYADAIEIWPEVAKLFEVQEGRGEALLRLGNREEALDSLKRAESVARTDSERALSVLKQGDALVELGRGEEAMSDYRRVLEKFPETDVAQALKRMVQVRELETKARDSYREFRFEEARDGFAKVAREDPSRRARMAYFEVLCLYGLGEDDKARVRARELSESCDDPVVRDEATLWLAKFLFNARDWKEAARLFVVFAERAPRHPFAPQALVWATRAAYSDGDCALAIHTATKLVERYPSSPERFAALLVQGEALIELTRFSEAVLVLESVAIDEGAGSFERMRARLLKADALFAMGADNPARYTAALEAYRAIRFGGTLEPGVRLSVSFKIARTLEKLKRYEEAADEYYSQVVIAYREGRLAGERYDDDARAAFSRAAFLLADEFESRGKDAQAMGVLRLVAESDVPAAEEAQKRLERISMKGRFL